jgi:long-chain acyl-CoA synthetase
MESTSAGDVGAREGARTVAEWSSSAAERYGERTAVRFKHDRAWRDLSFAEVAAAVQDLALGLIDLGVAPGDRICILANTRPEWTYADFAVAAAAGVVVPIYPTNSAEECEWVVGNSGAKVVICESREQLAKIDAVRGALPELETIFVIDPAGEAGDAISFAELRERGRGGATSELERRAAAVKPGDPFTFVYTSGTTGPPKGCVLSHGNWRAACDMIKELEIVTPGDSVYLYLPLAHVFARLVQLCAFDLGATIAYLGGGTRQIVPELSEVRPTFFPSVPRIFEKMYTLAVAQLEQASEEQRRQFREAVKLGVKVRTMRQRGEPVPEKLQRAFDASDEQLFSKVREHFGGRVREASTGAAPIAPEMLEFFYACGVPVLEGYGMTETTAVATVSTRESFKFGTVGRALPGTEIEIAPDGEILLKGPNVFQGYYGNEEATREVIVDGWLHTGDLGELDDEGYLEITGRKKDIIITAGGKNLTPANIENDLKQSPWISQAVMHGDRRPYPVALITLDEEEVARWAKRQGLPTDVPSLSEHARVQDLIQAELDRVNARYAQVEQIKKFTILDHDLAQETGELTPTLKVKRNVVNERYADLFDALY